MLTERRNSLIGLGLAVAATAGLTSKASATAMAPLVPHGAKSLEELAAHLEKAPRRRDFKSVPMILTSRDQWDAEALDAVLHYAAGPKQSWDNTDLLGPWLNVMRNAMNSEVYSFKHPDFLCLSATHGTAQFALYDDFVWDKYQLAKIAGPDVTHNSFLAAPPAASHDSADFQNPDGAFSPRANSIAALQRRGALFLACHNAVWEHCERLIKIGANPDKLTTEVMCAEISNHLVPGAILTPGAVGTLVELAHAGFAYAR